MNGRDLREFGHRTTSADGASREVFGGVLDFY
jgi:hypothetical protein